MHIAAVACAFPPHRYEQAEITAAFTDLLGEDDPGRGLTERVHRSSQVGARHLALKLEDYPRLDGFGGSNDAFIRVGTDLAEEALRSALADAGLKPRDLDFIATVTVTGVATPSIDARL